MFLTKDEMKSAIYLYQIDQITELDDDIITIAIGAAEDQAQSYLRPGNKKEWMDGRPLYDVTAIFHQTGDDRNALLLEMIKNIAVWYLIRLCNVDMIYDQVKDRYDRAIAWLQDVMTGNVILDLPLIDESASDKEPFRFGSRKKFNYE